jgi:hypothetical protein
VRAARRAVLENRMCVAVLATSVLCFSPHAARRTSMRAAMLGSGISILRSSLLVGLTSVNHRPIRAMAIRCALISQRQLHFARSWRGRTGRAAEAPGRARRVCAARLPSAETSTALAQMVRDGPAF